MEDQPKPISVQILDKDYLVGCPEDEKVALTAAARFLDGKMREMRDSGKVIGTERIAVITALNLAHELLQNRASLDEYAETVGGGLRRLTQRIDSTLQGDNQG